MNNYNDADDDNSRNERNGLKSNSDRNEDGTDVSYNKSHTGIVMHNSSGTLISP